MGLELNGIFAGMKRITLTLIFLVSLLLIFSCKKADNEYVMTVNGPILPEEMGTTLEHEHVLVDFIGADKPGGILNCSVINNSFF